MKSNTKPRIDWIDMAKGYGIIFVILGHLNTGILGSWLYTFHIPLFFFLSGYVFHTESNFSSFLKKKAKTILLPYFVLGIPMIPFAVMDAMKEGYYTKDMLIGYFASAFLIQRRLWTLWFIACLFWLNIIFYWIVKKIRSEKVIAVILIAMTCVGVLYFQLGGQAMPWNVDVCFTAIAFFGVGYFYKKHVTVVDAFLNKRFKPIVWLLGFLVMNIVCGVLTYVIAGDGLEMFYNHYGFAPLTYIAAFAGIFGTVIVAKMAVLKPIRYIVSAK